MTFSKEWNQQYKIGKNMSIWPWSDLVSYVNRYTNSKTNRVLELGCGAGANIPFFISLGMEYYGLDGSTTAITYLKKKFPKLKNNLIACDFTSKIPLREKFNLVIDRSSVTHNTTQKIKSCLKQTYDVLNFDGKFVGIDWFSTLHSDYKMGKREDPFTRSSYKTGQFANIGRVHFSNKSHLKDLFKNFTFLILEHKIIKREFPKNRHVFASWSFVVKK